MKGPKVLFLDIETAPIIGYVWGLWDNNVALNQIHSDWHILSWSAKWAHEKKVMYKDQRDSKNIEKDKSLLKGIWDLLDKADIVITQNGKKFDIKKLNARFIMNEMPPPSSYEQMDTLVIAKKHFGFTSNKLEYMSKNLNKKYTKQDHKKYPGFELWKACLAGDIKAWKEMEKYNKYDVLALEEVFTKLSPWDKGVNYSLYTEDKSPLCRCGSTNFKKNGYKYTASGKYHRYFCLRCGHETRGRSNVFSKNSRSKLRVGTR